MHRLLLSLLLLAAVAATAGHVGSSGSSCPFRGGAHVEEPHDHHDHGHSCGGGHSHREHHHHQPDEIERLLPKELAEEADLELDAFGHHHHHHHDHHHDHGDFQPETSPTGVWLSAMGCSLLVNMASLICLALLLVIFYQGKPSKAMVDSVEVFWAKIRFFINCLMLLMKLQKFNERVLALVKSSLNIVIDVGLLQLSPKKVTPYVTGAFGFASSLIICYQLLLAQAKSK